MGHVSRMLRAASLGLVVSCVLACGSAPVAKTRTPSSAAGGDALNVMPPPNGGSLRRSEVRQALSAGLGMFLQRVTLDVDHPVFKDHRFVGFRISALNGPGWNGIDLKPGDVVTAVNGFSVERPEQAQQAFLSLAVASELRVDYEREGQPQSLRLSIVDD